MVAGGEYVAFAVSFACKSNLIKSHHLTTNSNQVAEDENQWMRVAPSFVVRERGDKRSKGSEWLVMSARHDTIRWVETFYATKWSRGHTTTNLE